MDGRLHIACVLASGFSKRFGEHNKLLADFNGEPLIMYVLRTLKAAKFDKIYAIVPEHDVVLQATVEACNVGIIFNNHAERGQSYSLTLAAKTALNLKAKSLLISLGDMPFVTSEHVMALQERLRGYRAVISSDGNIECPPIIFDEVTIQEISELSGDVGAKTIFQKINPTTVVIAPKDQLRDIDTPNMLRDYSC